MAKGAIVIIHHHLELGSLDAIFVLDEGGVLFITDLCLKVVNIGLHNLSICSEVLVDGLEFEMGFDTNTTSIER